MEPHRRHGRHRLIAGVLAMLALGALGPVAGARTPATGALAAAAVRTLATDPAPDVAISAAAEHGDADAQDLIKRSGEGSHAWLRSDRLESAAQTAPRHDRGPRPHVLAVLTGLAAATSLMLLARRGRDGHPQLSVRAAGSQSRGPPSPV